ncbi:MAG TPA: rod shape-determining protein MreD [Candidatus Moranbacteria bacterium]|nr:rod shape-determining protein MreD [Candidatus Moranbacteria bacterium]HBT45388.1 rod shape-determining protein MreD [Candidatus Moranbacteria bacterium]
MKKKIVYCLLLFCAVVLQTSVLPLISPLHIAGDVVLMLILAGSVLDGFFAFFWWAIFAGIVYDLASYTTVGIHALIFLLVVYFVSFFSRRFSVEIKGVGVVLFVIFVAVATLLSRGIIALSVAWDLQTFNGYFEEFGNWKIIIFQILFNTFLFLFCFFVLKKVKKFFVIE